MDTLYTSKAKDDLAHINWREREDVISMIKDATENPDLWTILPKMPDSGFRKLKAGEYSIVTELREQTLYIISIYKQNQLKLND